MKSGFVNIIGNPNAGKSTLMNALLGEPLSIVNAKAQTTRHRILGIAQGDDYQVVFSDTPGIIKPGYTLQEKMMNYVYASLEDADILLMVIEPGTQELRQAHLHAKIEEHHAPLLIAINKIDTLDQAQLEKLNAHWTSKHPRAEVIPVSAKVGFQVDYLFDRIRDILPEGPAFFDENTFTDKTERFFASEIIREKILDLFSEEVPYSCQVDIESFKEGEERIRISAVIYVARDSQKGIVIGHKGQALTRLGKRSRLALSDFFHKPVHLDLFVKVNKNWRDNERTLEQFGYNS
jgi:GTP-binding protein Era